MTYLAPRPTTYCGIPMRSRLEARFAAKLDSIPAFRKWEYEPRAFANRSGQYLPDFRTVWKGTADTYRTYIEVKPTYEAADEFVKSGRMEIIWSSEPEAHLMVAYPDGDDWHFAAASLEDGGEWAVIL